MILIETFIFDLQNHRVHPLTMANMYMYAKFDEILFFDDEAHKGLGVLSCSQAYFNICLMWPWPLSPKINRVHPLVIVNMSAKFDE